MMRPRNQTRHPSRPGDPCRQSRVSRDKALAAASRAAHVAILRSGNHYVARLGVVTLGTIHCAQADSDPRFFWLSYLPGCRAAPTPAADLDKARAALIRTIEQWFEAAGMPLWGA